MTDPYVKFSVHYLHCTDLNYNSRITDEDDNEFTPDLFGAGNFGKVFLEFYDKHQCNHYCKWFGLEKPVAPESSSHSP